MQQLLQCVQATEENIILFTEKYIHQNAEGLIKNSAFFAEGLIKEFCLLCRGSSIILA